MSENIVDDRLLQRLLQDIRQEQAEMGRTLLLATNGLEPVATRLGTLEVRLNDLREDIRLIVSTEGLRTRVSLENKLDTGLALIRAELRKPPEQKE